MKFFGKICGYTVFVHKMYEEIFKVLKVVPANVKLRIIQIRLSTTCNKNEEQGAENNAEF